MFLTKLFPELLHKTVWANMPAWAADAVQHTINCEQEFGRPLPANSFNKMVAIRCVRQAQATFKAKAFA